MHRVVAKTFIPNPHNLPQVNHIDGNKENNCVSNLEWVTNYDNAHHAIENDLFENSIKALKESNDSRKTPIVAISVVSGEKLYFDSYSEARRKLGASHIHDVLNGRRQSDKGYYFAYA